MKSLHISKTVDRSVDVSVNPYKEALTQEVDGHLHEEPSLEMKKCDLAWSILSTEIDYTTNKDNSSYVEINTSNLYNKLQEDPLQINGMKGLKRLHAHCIIHTNLMTLMM